MFHPNAIHTRFHHSLGVASLIKLFLASLSHEDQTRHLEGDDEFIVVAAGLLHDVGHSAWGHVGEILPKYFKGMQRESHAQLSSKIVLGEPSYDQYFKSWTDGHLGVPRVRDILKDEEREKIAEIIIGRPPISRTEMARVEPEDRRNLKKEEIANKKQWMADIVESTVDFDTADSLRRDPFCTLANPGLVDTYSLTTSVGICETAGLHQLMFLSLPFAESFLLATELMYPAVYVESQNLIAEELLLRAFLSTYDQKQIDDFWFSTDEEVLSRLRQSKDRFVQNLLKLMMNHKTYDVIADVPATQMEDGMKKNVLRLSESRYGLLKLEDDVYQECKNKGVEKGDVVVSVWAWSTDFMNAKLMTQDRGCRDLVVESSLVNVMTSSTYPASRTKCVVGTVPGMAPETRNEVRKTVLSFLEKNKYG
jgi:HD superfamily phosphohydrolase